ncbi:MAG: heavy metal-binding domain-containing protein [Chloroflexi bacterium]|nr:heavy metal-binding domain-containing protein [Chloroflexota bacterium]
MIVVSTPYLPGYRVEKTLGLTWGLVVRSRGVGYQISAFFRSLFGGEIPEYTDMLNSARMHAVERLKQHAASLGANAVLGAAFDSSELASNMTEVLAYGTAVVVTPEPAEAQPVRLS